MEPTAPCDVCKQPHLVRVLRIVPGIRKRMCDACYARYRVARG